MKTITLKASDLSKIFGCSTKTAYAMLNQFAMNGQTVTVGKTKVITVRNLAKWMSGQDGEKVDTHMMDIIHAIKED